MEILTVCTGNICRSPLAELLLSTRLADLSVTARSAGVRGLDASAMTPEAIDLAVEYGVSEADAKAHRSRPLSQAMLTWPDLILAMTREHRRAIAELAPARLRATFTVREFARLAATLGDDELKDAVASAGTTSGAPATPGARLRAAVVAIAGRRGLVSPPIDAIEDDVIDPYRRDRATYRRSADQLVPALAEVERTVRIAVG